MDISNRVIGFIGLGAMGSRMAKRLIAAGFKVVVFDRTREKKERLAVQGAAMAPSPRTLAMEAVPLRSSSPAKIVVLPVRLSVPLIDIVPTPSLFRLTSLLAAVARKRFIEPLSMGNR